MSESMTLTLTVWRQKDKTSEGRFVGYTIPGVSPDMSFLEMLDLLNLDLIRKGRGARRVRSRLPGRDLRHVLPLHQRTGARPAEGGDRLPAPHADVP